MPATKTNNNADIGRPCLIPVWNSKKKSDKYPLLVVHALIPL